MPPPLPAILLVMVTLRSVVVPLLQKPPPVLVAVNNLF
jgi:hypothetical protein